MSGSLRVVHLNDIAHIGQRLVESLAAEGVDAVLISPRRFGVGQPYPRRLTALPRRGAALLRAAWAARRRQPDIIHLHYARFGWMAPLAGAGWAGGPSAARKAGPGCGAHGARPPYLVHCHGTDIRGTTPGSAWGRIVGPWLRGAQRVLYATPDLEPWVRAFRPDAEFLPNPIAIPSAVELRPGTVERRPGRDVLVGVRLDPIKGPDRIAATLARLLEIRPQTTLTVVDHGTAREAVLDAAGARAEVIPPVAHAAMPDLFGGHRLALGQMALGALGAYELEAMAAGLPVAAPFAFPAAYDVPPPVVDGGSPAETARRIAALLDDPAALDAAGRRSREWVTEHHAAAAIARRVADIYRQILAERR